MFGSILKQQRQARGLSQQKLADELNKHYKIPNRKGISKSMISRWENSKNDISMDYVRIIADYFGINPSNIVGSIPTDNTDILSIYNQLHTSRQKRVYDFASDQLIKQQTQASDSVMIDLQAKQESQLDGDRGIIQGRETAAGLPILGDEQDVNAVETVVHKRDVPESANEIVTVAGDSMEPDFPEYSQIFVHWQQSVDNGDLALVHVRDEGVTFKKIYIDNENKKVVLHSLNPKYQDRYFDADDIHVIGKVITD